MAGNRLTLRKLYKKYDLPLSGTNYQRLVSEIIEDNRQRAAKAVQKVSALRYRRAAKAAVESGVLNVPQPMGIPTVRKSAESGQQITDTLRDKLTRGLRAAIAEDPEIAIRKMVEVVNDTMGIYVKRPTPAMTAAAVKAIAVTEVRSAVDMAKYEYAKRFAEGNGLTMDVKKQWRHADHLVKVPREGHKKMNGVIVPFGAPFRVPTNTGTVEMLYPHDGNAPADEVIGCQCSYDILVSLKESDLKVEKSLTLEGKLRETERVLLVMKAKLREGTTKEIGGITYVLRRSRWHNENEEDTSEEDEASYESAEAGEDSPLKTNQIFHGSGIDMGGAVDYGWGYADKGNTKAAAMAFAGGGVYRYIEKDKKTGKYELYSQDVKLTPEQKAHAFAWKKNAQSLLNGQYKKGGTPTFKKYYRGLTLDLTAALKLMEEDAVIECTGVTAFSGHKKGAEEYAETGQAGVSVLFELDRDEEFDQSISYINNREVAVRKKDAREELAVKSTAKAPYEAVSSCSGLRVVGVSKRFAPPPMSLDEYVKKNRDFYEQESASPRYKDVHEREEIYKNIGKVDFVQEYKKSHPDVKWEEFTDRLNEEFEKAGVESAYGVIRNVLPSMPSDSYRNQLIATRNAMLEAKVTSPEAKQLQDFIRSAVDRTQGAEPVSNDDYEYALEVERAGKADAWSYNRKYVPNNTITIKVKAIYE